MKTIYWVLGGLAVAGAAYFILSPSTSSGNESTPAQRMAKAMSTPGTREYEELSNFNAVNRPGQTYEQALPAHIAWHSDPANNSQILARFA